MVPGAWTCGSHRRQSEPALSVTSDVISSDVSLKTFPRDASSYAGDLSTALLHKDQAAAASISYQGVSAFRTRSLWSGRAPAKGWWRAGVPAVAPPLRLRAWRARQTWISDPAACPPFDRSGRMRLLVPHFRYFRCPAPACARNSNPRRHPAPRRRSPADRAAAPAPVATARVGNRDHHRSWRTVPMRA